jgi:hypothetical protein
VIAILSSVWLQKQVKVDCKKNTPCRIKKEGAQKYIARVQIHKIKQKKGRKSCHIT